MAQVNNNYKELLNTLPEGVQLIAISKTKTPDEILNLYNSGQRIFGESKVQELIPKYEELPKDVEWHMVGHLQKNKVKHIAPFIKMVQSVDSFKLLNVLNNEAEKYDRVISCLFQIHIAEEETKFGMSLEEIGKILDSDEYKNMKNVSIRGLMGMATFTDDEDQIKKEFHTLKDGFEKTKQKYFNQNNNFSEISMGMSNDYQIAIAAGSTMIRIGTAIFGERDSLGI